MIKNSLKAVGFILLSIKLPYAFLPFIGKRIGYSYWCL